MLVRVMLSQPSLLALSVCLRSLVLQLCVELVASADVGDVKAFGGTLV